MITNLPGKEVLYKDKEAVICTVYQDRERNVVFGLQITDHFLFNVSPRDIKLKTKPSLEDTKRTYEALADKKTYGVFMLHTPDKKMMAIKTVRNIMGLGLRDAKIQVESYPDGFIIKDHLPYHEAQAVCRDIKFDGHDCYIRSKE